MIVQVLLTSFFIVLFIYGIASSTRSKLIARSLASLSLALVYFTWVPEHANSVAHILGVGRGADLLLYMWFPVSSFMLLLMNLKTNRLHRELTEIARAIALANAQPPSRDHLGS